MSPALRDILPPQRASTSSKIKGSFTQWTVQRLSLNLDLPDIWYVCYNIPMDKIRTWLRPETRGVVYTVAAAAVAALVTFGVISSTLAASVAGVVVGVITLIYAIIHSESNIRSVIYGLSAAIGALLVTLGTFTDEESEALLAVVAPVLGITLAAAKTPTRQDEVHAETWVVAE